MQNKTDLNTHNEVIPVSEPWHRGSGFTWMLLALAGAVFFLSGAVAKSQVTYTMNTGNFNSLPVQNNNNPPYAGTYNNGAELANYANGGWFGNTPGAAAFQTFTTTGNGNSGSVRALQIGDTFTITSWTGSNPSAGGYLGISFRDSTTYSSVSNATDSATEARFQLDNTGNWKVYSGGTAIESGSGANADRTFILKVTSSNTFNATVAGVTYYDLSMAGGGGTIDSFSIYNVGDNNPNSFWKNASLNNTGTVELGYGLSGSQTVSISGQISDGLAANSTSTATANAVFIGGSAGTQVNLSGANNYTGTTTVNNNAVAEARHADALGSTTGGTTVTSGGALKLYDASGISYAAEAITLNGVGVSGSGGALQSVGGNNTWNGAITAGSNTRIAATTGSLTVAGEVSAGSNVLYLGTAGGNITVSGAISGAGASQDGTTTSLFKDGSSTLTLSGNNTYSGDTRITAGALTVNSGGNLGNGNSDVYVSSGATLNVNTSLTVDSVQETGTGNGGVIALGSGATLTVDGENKGTLFQNSISGTGGITMAGSGDTSLSLYGTQSYTGATAVSGGKISSGTALASTSYTVSGGTMETSADGVIANNASISLTGGNFSLGGDDTVGALTATGGRLTVGSGKAANLSANSSIGTGAEIVGGTIAVNSGTTLTLNSNDGDNTSALSIASGGTLKGSATTTGSLSVAGTLAIGNSPGTLNVGATTFLAGGNYEWEINDFSGGSQGTNWDFLNVTGALTISATSGSEFFLDVIGLLPGGNDFVFTDNYSFAIATASGGITGFDVTDFVIRTNNFGSAMTASGYTSGSWSVGLVNSNKDLVLTYSGATAVVSGAGATAIPEPSVASMFVLGLSALLAKRRRSAARG